METRDERAAERVWEARWAWRLCSSRKWSIWSRPSRVSLLQLRSVFSSVFGVSVVLGRVGNNKNGSGDLPLRGSSCFIPCSTPCTSAMLRPSSPKRYTSLLRIKVCR